MNFRSHLKETLKLAIPVSLGQMGHILTMIADTAMLGNYDPDHLAASAFGISLIMPFTLFGIGYTMCLSPLVSQALGEKKNHRIAQYLKNAFLLFLVFGFLLLIIQACVYPFIDDMGQDASLIPLAKTYFLIIGSSVFFVVLFQLFKQFSEGLSKSTFPMYISLGGNAFNILGNYALIFGKFGMPEMGLEGAALSTFISRIFMILAALGYFIFHPTFKEYTFSAIQASYKKSFLKKLNSIGLPISIQYITEVSAFAITVIFIGWLGKEYLVAHQIAMNIAALTYMLGTGFGAAATVRLGFSFGEKNKTEMLKASKAGYLLIFLWMSCTALFLILCRNILPTFYLPDDEILIIQSAASLLLIAGLFQLSDGINLMGISLLKGMNDVTIPAIIGFISYWIISIPISYLLAFSFGFGVHGIWYGLVIGLTCSAILLFFRLRFKFRNLNF